MTGCADSEVFRKRLLARGRRRRARRHPLRPPRARRRPAHPLLVRGVARGDRATASRASTRSCAGTGRQASDDAARPSRDNRAARDAVLGRVRKALGKEVRTRRRAADAEAYIAAHAHGPRPAMPADLVARFVQRATDMAEHASSASPIAATIPRAVARYLDALELPPALAAQKSHAGVCWPEFADLDWAARGTRDRGAADGGRRPPRHHRRVLRDRRDRHAGGAVGRRHADRDDAAAGHARRRRARGSHRVGHGGGVRADPRRARRRCRARST